MVYIRLAGDPRPSPLPSGRCETVLLALGSLRFRSCAFLGVGSCSLIRSFFATSTARQGLAKEGVLVVAKETVVVAPHQHQAQVVVPQLVAPRRRLQQDREQ